MTTRMELDGQAEAMAQAMLCHGARYAEGEERQLEWREADGLRYRGTVRISSVHLQRAAALAEAIARPERLGALRSESGEAGDLEQVAMCDAALAGDEEALAECARVIADARAQEC